MLIDNAKIIVYGGKGGKGCSSLFKDIFNRKGIPDGGSGGDGGDVVIEGSANLHTLLDFKFRPHHKAGNGKHGGSNNKIGRRGEDLIVKVPLGTLIKDLATKNVLRDVTFDGQRVLVSKGGRGGRGNASKKEAMEGEDGEIRELILELKLMADAGLIGLPNAGKSTIITRISKAHSKIAAYPFTTKDPILGVVCLAPEASFVAADMPGLIEGAHSGKGLGDRFLKHIERTLVLVHVVDMAPQDGSDPYANYVKIEEELRLYDRDVYDKPRVIVASKMDTPGAEDNLRSFESRADGKVFSVSALAGTGLKELVAGIYEVINDVRKKDQENNGEGRHESADGPGEQDRPVGPEEPF
ncbi:MAG: Obg family GTPase CgtA [Candidatus Omnitrophica bacterium]|nr:Obg family GTPase CgtA [Candidatus Omnitrophota bacterium]MDD4013713.1 Obg family GTPase CgtA [Candidatus Omnitrophota bacterium]